MTTASPIAKRSKSGFTVLPNRLVDQVLASGTTHTVDTLALALYLVRHIPGQRGALVLAGDFSQATLCQDLGWGRTNRARLKRALSDLERLEIVTTELRDNNTVVVHITADLPTGVGEASIPTGCKDSSQGREAAKLFSHLGQENSSQASRASNSSAEDSKMMKKTKILNHHLLSTELRDNSAREATSACDDVRKLLDLYRSSLKKPVSIQVASSFADTYLANGEPFELVERGFQTLAKNPLLHVATTSPNAVWQLAYMTQRSAHVDARIRACISERRYSSESDETLRTSLATFATQNGYDEAIFLEFYASVIEDLFAKRVQDRVDRTRWDAANPNGTELQGAAEPSARPIERVEHPEPSVDVCGAETPDSPAGAEASEHYPELSSDVACATSTARNKPPADPLESTISVAGSVAESADGSLQDYDSGCEKSAHDCSTGQRGADVFVEPSRTLAGCLETFRRPNPTEDGDALLRPTRADLEPPQAQTPTGRSSVVAESCSKMPLLALPAELATAKSKTELRHLLVEALRRETCPDTRRRLSVLADFAAIEKTSFDMLRNLLRVHISPLRKVA